MSRPRLALLLTCEHGGNRVPAPWRAAFRSRAALLRSHRGWDLGALAVARLLARRLGAPLVAATTTRLLVDLNRSANRAAVFSTISAALPASERQRALRQIHAPHRAAVDRALAALLGRHRRVLHVAVHSFTPVLGGVRRNADVGLLYDPGRAGEAAFATAWHRALASVAPELRVRRNYPYLGKTDGLATSLRRRLAPERYVGFELELNQALLLAQPPRAVAALVAGSLQTAAAAFP